MQGPRIYNAPSFEEQQERLRVKQAKRAKEVKRIHRIRRHRIIALFVIVFIFLGTQVIRTYMQTERINQQVQTSKKSLHEINNQKQKLTIQRDNLQDPDYVAKLVRFKFLYSKPNETIYNLPEENNKNQ